MCACAALSFLTESLASADRQMPAAESYSAAKYSDSARLSSGVAYGGEDAFALLAGGFVSRAQAAEIAINSQPALRLIQREVWKLFTPDVTERPSDRNASTYQKNWAPGASRIESGNAMEVSLVAADHAGRPAASVTVIL